MEQDIEHLLNQEVPDYGTQIQKLKMSVESQSTKEGRDFDHLKKLEREVTEIKSRMLPDYESQMSTVQESVRVMEEKELPDYLSMIQEIQTQLNLV